MNETNSVTSTNVVGNIVDSIKDSDSLFEGLLTYFTNLEPIDHITFTINPVSYTHLTLPTKA